MADMPGKPVWQAVGPDAEKADLLIRRLTALPSFPCVVVDVIDLVEEAESVASPTDRAAGRRRALDRIACDPALTAKLLSLVARRRPARPQTAGEALEAADFDTIRAAALACAGAFDDDLSGLDRPKLWKHSLAVATAAGMLAGRGLEPVDPEEAYSCGLLHDVGKLALACLMPKAYRRVVDAAHNQGGDVALHEQQILGLSHWAAGRILAEHWRLPPAAGDVLWLSHQPPAAIPQTGCAYATVATVKLADEIAHSRQLGDPSRPMSADVVEYLAGRLGLGADAVEEVAERLTEDVEVRYAALGLHRLGDGQAEAGAPLRIGIELGRLNEKLLGRTDLLATRAAAFDHLRDFAAAFVPDAGVGEVLGRVAAAVAGAAGCEPAPQTPVVAYSLGDPGGANLVLCRSGGERTSWRTILPPAPSEASAPLPHTPAEVLAAIAGDPTDLSDWVDVSACLHEPIRCAGSWIGGVFFSPTSRSGEPSADAQVPRSVAAALAPALALVQGRTRATRVSEQLAAASQVLAATQEALAEARTLSAVAEMAAGAAHEVNNPLAVIAGRAQRMAGRAESEDDRKTWRLVAEQAQQISDIISELMEFARPPAPTIEDLDVRELLESSVKTFAEGDHPQAGSAKVDIETEHGVPPVRADAVQIRRALVELMANAVAATGQTPRIRLAASFDRDNGMVRVVVSDDGGGMDEPTLHRAFTPFFSSQEAGRRRGMGLPRVKRIVESNGGRVRIRSRVGAGTSVSVELPAAAVSPDPEELGDDESSRSERAGG